MEDPTVDAATFGVDGSVISADDLVSRVAALLSRPDGAEPPGQPTPPIVASLSDLRAIGEVLAPQPIARAPGVRGWVAWLVKRVVRKLTAWYVEPRWEAQRVWGERVVAELDRLALQNLAMRLQVLSFFEQLSALYEAVEEALPSAIAASADEVRRSSVSKTDLDALRHEMGELLRRLGAASATSPEVDYGDFEKRFRGSSEQVRAAQSRYVAVLRPLAVLGTIVDVGCGRGELLELLRDAELEALGVDASPAMVKICTEKGLEVVEDDGIRFVERARPSSLGAVTCLHVIEGLLTSEIERLVRASFDALAPGGAFVIETINPRSLHSLGNHFYADTSHVRPVHPETLRFLCEQAGFGAVDLAELSRHPAAVAANAISPTEPEGRAIRALVESVFGYQDYAIVAVKSA